MDADNGVRGLRALSITMSAFSSIVCSGSDIIMFLPMSVWLWSSKRSDRLGRKKSMIHEDEGERNDCSRTPPKVKYVCVYPNQTPWLLNSLPLM